MGSRIKDKNWSRQTRLRNEAGQALAEVGLVLGLIAVVCILALTSVGFAVSGSLDSFASAFGDAEGGSSTVPDAPEQTPNPPEQESGPPEQAPGPPDHEHGPPGEASGPPDHEHGPPAQASGPQVVIP
ncbi:MAG: hypothetical protein IH957_09740 [Chloroflexi bacterium]|nr:hypothetical protein [Chloroflexota bacterium]